jgi:tetratricopeptide (TPR) repeat protein
MVESFAAAGRRTIVRQKLLTLSLAVLCATIPLAAQASKHAVSKHPPGKADAKPLPELLQGCALYNAGKYSQALPYLQAASRKRPSDWQAHYYLGHTLLSMGQRSEATTEYRYCMGCNPKPDIVTNCQNAIVGMYPRGTFNDTKWENVDNGVLMKPNAYSISGDRQNVLNVQKEKIGMEAREQEARINADSARTINNLAKSPYTPLMDRLDRSTTIDQSFAKPWASNTQYAQNALKEETKKKLQNVK